MNKQELIEYCEFLKGDLNKFINGIDVNKIIKKIEQLDEPQKVTVPQFVADWIENVKRNSLKQKNNFGFYEEITSNDSVYRVMYYIFKEGIAAKDVKSWVWGNLDTFARAWLDGYEVEKEPKYTVKVKATKQYLSNDEIGIHFDPSFRTNFTKSDLEKLGLDWVFDCEGIEVEEVEG